MQVNFTPEQEAKLSTAAERRGMKAERFVKETALLWVEENERFRAAVREGVDQAERGELIEDQQVLGWLEDQERR